MLERKEEATSRDARGRCLVLTPPGVAAPEALRGALASRDLAIEPVSDVFQAMALMALHEGSPSTERSLLAALVVEPSEVPRASELAELAPRYAPSTILWQYREDASPQLSTYLTVETDRSVEVKQPATAASRPADAPALAHAHASHASPASSHPSLRLAGDGPALAPLDDRNAAEEAADDDSASLDALALSDEELAMLLSDEWETDDAEGDDAPPRQGPSVSSELPDRLDR